MDQNNSKYVVKVGPKLSMENSRELRKDLAEALERGIKQVELDFFDTHSIDSSGLGKLLLFNEKFTESGGSFKVINVNHAEVLELFKLINVDRFISVEYKS